MQHSIRDFLRMMICSISALESNGSMASYSNFSSEIMSVREQEITPSIFRTHGYNYSTDTTETI